MLKRLMSLLVAVTMLVSLFSATAVAQETVPQNDTEMVTPAAEPEAPKEEPKENTGDTADGAEDIPTSDTPVEDDTTTVNEPPAPTEEKGEDEADDPAPADGEQEELIDQPPTDEAIAEQIAAATTALAALPDEITWDAFAAVEAAGAALAAVPAELQAQVEGANKLQPAIDALLAIYADALAALDPTADVWENQHVIKAVGEMKRQMDAALYVKPADDMSLMGDGAADLSWLTDALAAYATAEATIIPDGADGDMALTDTFKATDYATLQKALNEVDENDTVNINKNIELTEQLVANNPVAYTINTNKKTLDFKANGTNAIDNIVGVVGFLVTAGTVTMKGGGELVSTDEGITTVLSVTGDAEAVNLNDVNVTVSHPRSHDTNLGVAVYMTGAKLTVTNSTLTATSAGANGIPLVLIGKDENNNASAKLSSGTKLVGDVAFAPLAYADYELDGVVMSAKLFGVFNEAMFDNNTVTGSIQNSTITVEEGCAVVLLSSKELTITNTTMNAEVGILIYTGELTVKGCEVTATGNALAIHQNDSYDGDINVTVDGTDISSTNENAIRVTRGDDAEAISLTINNSTVTAPDGKRPIYASGLTPDDIAAITIAKTAAYPALEDGSYTLAQGQQLFTTGEGGNVVAASIADAFKLADSITLTGNYTQPGRLTIPQGKTLDTGDYVLEAMSTTVNGTLCYTNTDTLITPTTVTSTGTLKKNGAEAVYIAPKASDSASTKPVYGLHEGAQMSVKKSSATGVITFIAEKGDITIQNAFDGSKRFYATSDTPLYIDEENATVWLAFDVLLGSKLHITGTIHYIVATNANGTKQYETLYDAVANETSVKVVRDLDDRFSCAQKTMVIDKSMTIDFGGHKVYVYDDDGVDDSGFVIGSSRKINVTLKNGTVIYSTTNDNPTDVVAICAKDMATVTLDHLTAQVILEDLTTGAVLRVEDGAAVSAVSSTIDNSDVYGMEVRPGGTLKMKDSFLKPHSNRPIMLCGEKGKKTTVEFTNVEITGYTVLGSYLTLTMTDCPVSGVDGNIFDALIRSNGSCEGTEVTITGGSLSIVQNMPLPALSLPNIKRLTMTGTKIASNGYGIQLTSGTITLNDVTVSAGDAALSVIAASGEGDPLSLTINGGSYTATNGNAFIYGHASGAEARTLTIKSEGAEFTGTTAAIAYSGNGTAPTVQTSSLYANPAVADGLLNATGTTFGAKVDGTPVTVVSKTLTEAFAMHEDVAITLQVNYVNAKEDLLIGTNNALDVNGKNLTVRSITSYGEITALTTSAITASKFVQYGRLYEYGLYMKLQSAATLAGNTVLELLPLFSGEYYYYCELIINDLSPSVTSGRVVASDWEGSALLMLDGDYYTQINVRALFNGEDASAEITVVDGFAVIFGNTKAFLDDGNNLLIINSGARVYVEVADDITSTKNITGNVLLEEVDDFIDAVAALPNNPEDITYKHYDLVINAYFAYDYLEYVGLQDMPAVTDSLKKYNQIIDMYLDAYIQTAPVEMLFTLNAGGTVEPGGTVNVPAYSNATGLPSDVKDQLNDGDKYDWVVELSDNEKFKLENGTITAQPGANSGDSVTITVYAQGKDTLSAYRSASATTTLLVAPTKNDATLKEVVLESYTYTVNKSGATKDISIPVKYVYSNGMTYGADGHVIGADLALVDEGRNFLSAMYAISFDAENDCIVLTLKEDATLAKNKTYTGRINFGTIRKDGTPYPVPNSALVSVKVTDVVPKVTVKVANADLLYVTETSAAAGGKEYTLMYDSAMTLGGKNAADVEGITFSDITYEDGGKVTFSYTKASNLLTIKSTVRLTKGMTLKPVATLLFTEQSDFAPVPQTVSIKLVETALPVKLAKTSATVLGKAGDAVTVQLVGTNKKAPYELDQFTSIEVLETKNKQYEPSETAKASYSYDRKNDVGIITVTLKKDVTDKSVKLTLRPVGYNSPVVKYLPFTLNVKPLSAKLQTSAVTFNIKSKTRTADVGVTVTPDSAGVTLTKVGDTAAANGVATVDGITFTCNNAKAVTVDVSAATLVKGTKKYSLTFEGIAKPLTLSVKVEDKYQTVKLQKSSATLNVTMLEYYDNYPCDCAEVPLLYSEGILDGDMVEVETSHSAVYAGYDDMWYDSSATYGFLWVQMRPSAPKTATVTIRIKDGANVDPKKGTLTFTVKKNDKPITLKASVSGKLDPLNPNSTVTAKLSLSGTAECINTKTVFKEVDDRYYLYLDNEDIVVIKDYKPETAQLILGWANGANNKYGTGKYNVDVILFDDYAYYAIVTLPNATTVTAEASKLKLTAQTATLYQSLPYEYAKLAITTGNTQTDKLISNVWLAKQSNYYTVERTADGFGIRYKGGKADFGSKWKATDSVQLNVTYVGSSKVYTVKVPIVNVQTQPTV